MKDQSFFTYPLIFSLIPVCDSISLVSFYSVGHQLLFDASCIHGDIKRNVNLTVIT